MSIIFTVMAIGLPSFQSFIINTRLISSANAMVSALQFAKSEAIKQHKNVLIIPKDRVDWQSGWLIFVDLNNNFAQDDAELTLTEFDSLSTTIDVVVNSATKKYQLYDANGRSSPNRTFTFCSQDGKNYRDVIVFVTGRERVQSPKSDSDNSSNKCPP